MRSTYGKITYLRSHLAVRFAAAVCVTYQAHERFIKRYELYKFAFYLLTGGETRAKVIWQKATSRSLGGVFVTPF